MAVKTLTADGFGYSNVSKIIARENAATPAAAEVTVRDGSVTGAILFVIELAANETKQLDFPTRGNGRNLDPPGGVFIDITAGSAEVTVVGDP